MTDEEIFALANEYRYYDGRVDAMAFGRAVEAAAIERCAEVADMVRSKFSSNGHIQQAAGAWCVHEELRALLPKEES